MTEALISLKNVTKIYDGKAVIGGVSLDIFRGEILCVLGESGGGKTTLLNVLAGLISPDGGKIIYAGGAAPKVSYAFQEASLLPNLTALKNMTFAGGKKTACETLLARAELSDKAGKSSALRFAARLPRRLSCCLPTSRFPRWILLCASE